MFSRAETTCALDRGSQLIARAVGFCSGRLHAPKMQDFSVWQDFVHQEVSIPLLQYAAKGTRVLADEMGNANVELLLCLGMNWTVRCQGTWWDVRSV
jgi:hypothetical protein